MNRRPRPPLRRRRIGQRLKAMREAAKMNLDAASAKLDMTRSSLHRIEVGETRATVHIVRSMLDLYDVYVEGFIDDVRAALKPSWLTQYGVQDLGYVDAETEASSVLEYTCLNIPGPAPDRALHPCAVQPRPEAANRRTNGQRHQGPADSRTTTVQGR